VKRKPGERLCFPRRLQGMTKFAIISANEVLAMATMNVSLPDKMKDWAEDQARSGRYSNVSDYVRDLIRRDQERSDKIAAMQRLVDEGLASGIGEQSASALFDAAKKRARGKGR